METMANIKAPTDNQLKFAIVISSLLRVPLPKIQTRQSLFLFIRDNKPKLDKMQKLEPTAADADPEDDEAELLGFDICMGALND